MAGVLISETFVDKFAANDTQKGLIVSLFTVGAFGGWVQGGGHSIWTSLHGLGSDQVLSVQVVAPDGRFLTLDAQTNTDLFWAIRGGGGSQYIFKPRLHTILTRLTTRHLGHHHFHNRQGLSSNGLFCHFLLLRLYLRL